MNKISLLDEIIRRLQLSLKCMDNELQCVFEAYEIEDMINKLITIKKLNKDIEEWNKQEKCTIDDGRTEREKYLEQRCEELENKIRKMEIENNLMRVIIKTS